MLPTRVAFLLQVLLLSAAAAAATSSSAWVEGATPTDAKCYACPDEPGPGQACCGADGGQDTCPDGSACCDCGSDQFFGCQCPYVPPPAPPAGVHGILVAGDSWGSEGDWGFQQMMKKHVPESTRVINIAVPGSTASDWEGDDFLGKLVDNAKVSDYIWLPLMANDCAVYLPECASGGIFHKGKTAEECGDHLVESVTPRMQKILEAIHTANPKVRILGHGYDILGFSMFPMGTMARNSMFPQCKNGEPAFNRTMEACVNTQFVRIQGMWESFAKQYDFVDVINVLGTIQAVGGNKKASTGHPDMNSFAPPRLMEFNAMHPTPRKGFPFIFEKQWELYWSKHLLKAAEEMVVV